MSTGAELLGQRGTDLRLESHERAGRETREERRRGHLERMDAKAAARDELSTERDAGHWVSPDDADGDQAGEEANQQEDS